MLTTDPRFMNLIALGMAKITYGALEILRRYLGDDLELGLIGFAIVLRTRRDLFKLVEQHGLNKETMAAIISDQGYYTSINEISRYTGLNRATVRRKMQKLSDLELIEKIEDDKWHLKDFEHGEKSRAELLLSELLQTYLATTNKLEVLLPEEVKPVMQQNLSALGPIEARALLDEEVKRKVKRGLEVRY